MDLWSIGCIMFELYTQYPLFPGKNELDQISTIFAVMGTPPSSLLREYTLKTSRLNEHFGSMKGIGVETLIPDAPPDFLDLLKKLLELDPRKRIDAR